MAAITFQDITFTGIVTLMAGLQLAGFAKKTGSYRRKYKIDYPKMTGDENFERALRAQQNSLEFFPIFMVSLWTSSLFFHQGASCVAGIAYLYSRHRYYEGYLRSAKERLPGFQLGAECLMIMAAMSAVGFTTALLRQYADIDLGVLVRTVVQRNLGISI